MTVNAGTHCQALAGQQLNTVAAEQEREEGEPAGGWCEVPLRTDGTHRNG